MPHRDPARLNALLSAHARRGKSLAALFLFRSMHRDGILLDGYSFTPVLNSCAAIPSSGLRLGHQVHALMFKTGFHSEPIPATSLLDMYFKCGSAKDAVGVFDEMPVKDVVAWNAVISGLVRCGHARRAFDVFFSMVDGGIAFNEFTLCAVLKACVSKGAVSLGKQIHGWVVLNGCHSLVVATSLVDLYSSFGVVSDAMQVLHGLRCPKDNAIYNALIAGCVNNNRYAEAFALLREVRPDRVTLTSALAACSECLNFMYGKQIHSVAIRHGFDYDTILCNALVDMYAKCGDTDTAFSVFTSIREKNVVSWSSIIDAYGCRGHGAKAVKLFKEMEEGPYSVSPNAVTFLSVLSACAHSGLVDEGSECFHLMRNTHGIEPGPEHYACFIDLLGRAGRTEEAGCVYSSAARANKLTVGVCVAMLNACRVGMDLVRSELVATHLLEMEPDNPAIYVLISNFYADVGRWEGAEDMRKLILDRGLRKEVGNSQIDISGC